MTNIFSNVADTFRKRGQLDPSTWLPLSLLLLAKERLETLENTSAHQQNAELVNLELGNILRTAEPPLDTVKRIEQIKSAGLLETVSVQNIIECIETIQSSPMRGVFGVSSELAKLMVSISQNQMGNSAPLYLPCDSALQLLLSLAESDRPITCEVRTHSSAALVAAISILLDKPIEIGIGDTLVKPYAVEKGKLIQFPACVSAPPIALKLNIDELSGDLFNRFERKESGLGDVAWCRHILSQCSGTAVIAVTPKLLFASGKEKHFRQSIVESGYLQAVVSLPSGLLNGTTIGCALLVLNKKPQQETLFINSEPMQDNNASLESITAWICGGEKPDSRYCHSAQPSEIVALDSSWQPFRYVLSDAMQSLRDFMADALTTTLGELATVIRSPLPKAGSGIEALELRSAQVPDLGPIPISNTPIEIGQEATAQALKPLDVVVIAKGNVGRIGIIRNVHAELATVPNQSLYVIRCADNANSYALYSYLRSEYGQLQLSNAAIGVSIKSISIKDLRNLKIPQFFARDVAEAQKNVEKEWLLADQIEELRQQQRTLKAAAWVAPQSE